MKNRRDLQTILYIMAGIFGYFCLKHFRIEFKILFFVFMFVAAIVYIIEAKKNNYNKVSLTISILVLMLSIALLINDLITSEYIELLYLQGYFVALIAVIISAILIIGSVYYIKVSSRKNVILMVVILSIMALCIVLLIISVIQKNIV